MFISPTDNPKLLKSEALVAKEPINTYYIFKVQFFELTSVNEINKWDVVIEASIGHTKIVSKTQKYSNTWKTYLWKSKNLKEKRV